MNLLKFTLRLKGFNLEKARTQLSDSSSDHICRRNEIVEYHKANNPLYQLLTENLSINKFEDLPIVTKRDLQRPLSDIISTTYKLKNLYIANTSGSSGTPFFYAKNKDSHAITHAIIERLYQQHGLTADLKQARFYGIPVTGVAKYKELMKDFLCNRVRFPIFDLSDENLERYLNRFKKGSFGYIYGYTSAITLFSRFLIRNNIVLSSICPSLKACVITSEVCTPEDRKIISEALGVKIINEYGCSEAGIIAFEDTGGVWRMIEDDSYFEIVDSKGNPLPYGMEGRILITSLSNKALPIIRYEVGDVGVIEKDEKGLILKNLSGRVSDVVRLPSGKIAGGLTFYYISREVLERNNMIREFIVRQTALDSFIFDVVAVRDISFEEIALLQRQLDEYLEPGLKLTINRVDKIERPNSGKIKHFYSQI